jgi:hypothetical protein
VFFSFFFFLFFAWVCIVGFEGIRFGFARSNDGIWLGGARISITYGSHFSSLSSMAEWNRSAAVLRWGGVESLLFTTDGMDISVIAI